MLRKSIHFMMALLCICLIFMVPDLASAKTVKKNLGNGKISTSNGKISINKKKKTVTLNKSGTYTLSGKIGTYRVLVGKKKLAVTLKLKGVTAKHSTAASIYNPQSTATLVVQTVKGSKNKFTGPSKFANEKADAVIYSVGNLRLSGAGQLTVKDSSSNGHAVASDKNLGMSSGTFTITSSAACLKSNNINLSGGSLKATSGDTAIKASGKVKVTGGSYNITSIDKGIQGKKGVAISKGTIKIKTSKSNNPKFEDFRGITAGVSGSNGKKAVNGFITISGGTITIDSFGDCIRAANDVLISGGTLNLTSRDDDGIQAKGTLKISGNPKLSITAQGKKVKGETENIAGNISY